MASSTTFGVPILNHYKSKTKTNTKTVSKQQSIVSIISRQPYNYQKVELAHVRVIGKYSNRPITRASSSSEAEPTTMTTTIEKAGVKIVKNPPESTLTELGVRSWPKWGCPPSKFPWTYSGKETCYLLKGKVKVYPQGSDEAVEIGVGDLVVFPKGMTCTWDVSEEVDKHYNFE